MNAVVNEIVQDWAERIPLGVDYKILGFEIEHRIETDVEQIAQVAILSVRQTLDVIVYEPTSAGNVGAAVIIEVLAEVV